MIARILFTVAVLLLLGLHPLQAYSPPVPQPIEDLPVRGDGEIAEPHPVEAQLFLPFVGR